MEISGPGAGLLLLVISQRGTQNNIAIALGCPPELDGQ